MVTICQLNPEGSTETDSLHALENGENEKNKILLFLKMYLSKH